MPFHLEPIHAEGEVRITFFYDPDGTLLELVEGALQYHEVFDRDEVEKDWGLGAPDRPRFDHVAETVDDAAIDARVLRGPRLLPHGRHPSAERSARLRDHATCTAGDSTLEIFEYGKAEKSRRAPQLDAPGFVAVEFDGDRACASDPGRRGARACAASPTPTDSSTRSRAA